MMEYFPEYHLLDIILFSQKTHLFIQLQREYHVVVADQNAYSRALTLLKDDIPSKFVLSSHSFVSTILT